MKIKTWDDMPAGSVLRSDDMVWVKAEGGFIAPDLAVYHDGMEGKSSFNIRDWGGLEYFPMQYLT